MVYETPGIYLSADENSPEAVAAQFEQVSAPDGQLALQQAFEHTEAVAARAAKAMGITLPPRQGGG